MFARQVPPKSLLNLILRFFSIVAWCLRIHSVSVLTGFHTHSLWLVTWNCHSTSDWLWLSLDLVFFFFFWLSLAFLVWETVKTQSTTLCLHSCMVAWWLLRLAVQLLRAWLEQPLSCKAVVVSILLNIAFLAGFSGSKLRALQFFYLK